MVRGRVRRLVVLPLAVVIGLVVVVFAWQALHARSALLDAADDATVLQQQLADGDTDTIDITLASLQQSTASARDATDGVLWDLGARLPVAGPSVDAVQTVADELDRVATEALPPIVALAGDIDAGAFSPRDGRVDVEPLTAAAPRLGAATAALSASDRALEGLDVGALLLPLKGPVQTAQQTIASAAAVASNADLAARLLPDAVGSTGTRRYLLLNQNSAEVRPLGGIPGSFAILTAQQGRLSITDQGSIQDLPTFDEPVVTMTDDERAVFPTSLATDIRDVTITPDFPRAAQIAARMVQRKLGVTVDGVIAVDPVALGYQLTGLGPVRVTDAITLDRDNAVDVLLNRVYADFSPTEQDDFFERANRAVFSAFTAGRGEPVTLLRGLVRSVDEKRVLVWMRRPAEQRLIAPTDLSGAQAAADDGVPRVGIYFSDAASTKMEYYLRASSTMVSTNCLEGGRQVLSTATEVQSTAPASGVPSYVTGDGRFVERGSMRLNVRLMSPVGGHFTSVRVDGDPQTVYADRWHGRNVTRVSLLLKPGQTVRLAANVTSARGQTGDAVFSTTPGIESLRNDYAVASACAD